MSQTLSRLIPIAEKGSVEEADASAAEIDAKEFRKARRDPRLRRFAKAADERLGKLRAQNQID